MASASAADSGALAADSGASAADSGASPTAHSLCWPIMWHTQPVFLQTVWPGFPITLSYGVTASRPPRPVTPYVYHRVLEKQTVAKRVFFLDISVFDLVDAHKYLSLTDPKLLSWYLSLCPEDRTIIQNEGGLNQFLQRHPALELSQHHVYVKYLQMYPSNVMESLSLQDCSNSRGEAPKHPCEEVCHSKQQVHLQDGLQTQEPTHQKASTLNGRRRQQSSGAAACEDPAGLANFSLDMDLEGRGPGGQSELRSRAAAAHCHRADYTYAEVTSSQSDWESIEKDLSPDYFSFDSDREYSDCSLSQTAELQQVGPTQEEGQGHGVSSVEGDGDQSDTFHTIMEDDKGILVCLTSAASSETLKSESVVKQPASPAPCGPTCEAGVGTEPPPRVSSVTQTEDPPTADKHVITEVHMADLDYLTAEFIKLQLAQDELREQKGKRSSLGCKWRKDCECVERAQQAELSLLALQYSMCTQQCWRLYCTSAEGGQLHPELKSPPANLLTVLHKLESDFNLMRDQMVAGVPLGQLEPLSVDCEKITSGARYVPAQMIADVLGNVSSRIQETQRQRQTAGDEGPDGQSRRGSEFSVFAQRKEKQTKTEDSKAQRAATLVPQDRNALQKAHNPEDEQRTAVCRELSTCEAWYDAEEHLQPADTGAGPAGGKGKESSSEVSSSVLCVSNLPAHVTESEVMLWLERYQPSEVSVCSLKNHLSVAIVTVSGAQAAEAAASELNGCSLQGRTLHVEHITRAAGGSQSQSQSQSQNQNQSQSQSQSRAPVRGSSQDTDKPQACRTEACSSEGKPVSQPPLSPSPRSRRAVCTSPSAKATCVPQHYGTMGSFDTLLSELTQRHPEAGRQSIVDALIELKASHRGALSGLPLRTIRDMASELLTRPEGAAQR